MEKRILLAALIGIVGTLATSLFALYKTYPPMGAEEAGEIVVRSFILYAGIMVGTVALLLLAFYVQIYVLRPKITYEKVKAQEWVVKGELQVQTLIDEMNEYLDNRDFANARLMYKKAYIIYNWLKDYELSESKRQEYYLTLDRARTKLTQYEA